MLSSTAHHGLQHAAGSIRHAKRAELTEAGQSVLLLLLLLRPTWCMCLPRRLGYLSCSHSRGAPAATAASKQRCNRGLGAAVVCAWQQQWRNATRHGGKGGRQVRNSNVQK
jgi:hypothetical protein